ncbi:MAG: hypothetical protein JEZ06_00250 [Anaerolineaceae bacterium]|nr:hypothetical protein [Anaerolineaceae bacterium]
MSGSDEGTAVVGFQAGGAVSPGQEPDQQQEIASSARNDDGGNQGGITADVGYVQPARGF